MIRSNRELAYILAGTLVWFTMAVVSAHLSGVSTITSGTQKAWAFILVPVHALFSIFVAGPPALLAGVGFIFRHIGVTVALLVAALAIQIWTWPPDPPCQGAPGCDDPFQTYRYLVIFCWCLAALLAASRFVEAYNDNPFRQAERAHNETHFGNGVEDQGEELEIEPEAEAPLTPTQPTGRETGGRKKQYWEHYEDE